MDIKEVLPKLKWEIQKSLIVFIQKYPRLLRVVERLRGLYRYPNHMLGRKCSISLKDDQVDILVFAAHQDDDVLGLGTVLRRHRLKGERVKMVYVTNGSGNGGESWYIKARNAKKKADERYKEAVNALSLIDISEGNIHCLGYPDAGSYRYLTKIAFDVSGLITQLNPKRIYVHSIEGGHKDHDFTSFAVKSICKKINYTNVFEWAEYHPSQPMGTPNVTFLSQSRYQDEVIEINAEERALKKEMLAAHHSQNVVNFYTEGETIRQVEFTDFEKQLRALCKLSNKHMNFALKDFNHFMDKYNVDSIKWQKTSHSMFV